MLFPKARVKGAGTAAITLALTVACGCSIGPLTRQTAAFSKATTEFASLAPGVYDQVQSLHEDEEWSSILNGATIPTDFNPYTIQPLLSDADMKARKDAMDALNDYAAKLDYITTTRDTKALESASKEAGSALSQQISSIEPKGKELSKQETAALQTAVFALGEFQVERKISKDLPPAILKVDPAVQSICGIFKSDADVLTRQANDDFSQQIQHATQSLLKNQQQLAPDEKGRELQQIRALVHSQKAIDGLLQHFGKTSDSLAVAHHALATTSEKGGSATLRQRVADLQQSATQLARFYDSITSTTSKTAASSSAASCTAKSK